MIAQSILLQEIKRLKLQGHQNRATHLNENHHGYDNHSGGRDPLD